MKCNEMTLINLTIGKGEYGIGAPAVPYSDKLPTYLRITDINDDGTLNYSNLKSVDSKNSYKYFLNKNDIVFARTGASTGRNFFYDGPEKKYVYAGFLIKFSINPKKVNPYFIKYYCQSIEYYNWINSVKTGSTRGNINAKMLAELPIKLPSRKQQDKMVKILSALDDKIELNNKINENLLQIGSLIFKKYYELGKLETLESIINIIESGSREKGGAIVRGIPSIGAEKIERFGIYDYSKEKFISKKYFNNLKKGIIKSGDILLYKDGAYTGKSTMALNNYPYKTCAINEHVFILRTINNFAQFYLYFCISKEEIKSQIFSLASSKAAQPGLNQKELFSVKAKIPTKKLIYEFEKIVEPLMNMISENSLESNKLKQLRDTLLPKLMSGELDVSNLDI